MNIFLNLLGARNGGQITRAIQFCNCLAEYDKCNSNLTIIGQSKLISKVAEAPNIQKISIILPFQKNRILAPISRLIWENTVMINKIKRLKPDVFLTFSHSLPIRALGIPSVVGVSNVAPFSRTAYIRAGWLEKVRLRLLRNTIISSCRKATAIFGLSKHCQQYMKRFLPANIHIEVIPNGVQKQKNLSISSSKFAKNYILTVSHFYSYKNLEVLIKGYSCLPSHIKDCYDIVIVGHPCDKAYFEKIVNLIKKESLTNRVIIKTDLKGDELTPIYKHAGMFIFTSLVENCPNILLEAMSFGLPIIVCNEEPMPEFAGSSALYFEATSEHDLADKIKMFASDVKLTENYAQMALTHSKNYSWQAFSVSVLDLCQAACNQFRG